MADNDEKWKNEVSSRRKLGRRFIQITFGVSVLFGYIVLFYGPDAPDRRQLLAVMATMSATLLGLVLAASTFLSRIHLEYLESKVGSAIGPTPGMRNFHRSVIRVTEGLAFSAIASLFGLLFVPGALSLVMIAAAVPGLVYCVLFISILVSDVAAMVDFRGRTSP